MPVTSRAEQHTTDRQLGDRNHRRGSHSMWFSGTRGWRRTSAPKHQNTHKRLESNLETADKKWFWFVWLLLHVVATRTERIQSHVKRNKITKRITEVTKYRGRWHHSLLSWKQIRKQTVYYASRRHGESNYLKASKINRDGRKSGVQKKHYVTLQSKIWKN